MKMFRPLNRQILTALLLMVVLILGGTLGYSQLEGYSLVDGFYMTIITVTTVGFGEIHPLSTGGRMFTSILILFGFASLAFIGQTFAENFFSKLMSSNLEKKKMLKEISLLNSHYIICGFGRVGEAVAEKLQACGASFVFIETNTQGCQKLKEKNYIYIEGDAINDAVLESAGIKNANGLLAILPSVPDNLFITLTARELNATLHIIARADNKTSEKRLLQGGADSVISPYTSAGHQIASNMLAAAGNVDTAQQSVHIMKVVPQWFDVLEGSGMIGQTIGQLSKEMKHKVFGLRRLDRDYLDPDYSWKIEAQDKFLVLEDRENNVNEQAGQKPKPKTVVIVDDNPVIVKLYSRLLHRAGFVPLTAKNGSEAVKLIIEEKPDAAVIDFMLPILSGIEICKKVRAEKTCDDVKLILFTGDEQAETRERALKAGANAVVVKSPQASELIETVIYLLQQDLKCPSDQEDVSRPPDGSRPEANDTPDGSDPVKEPVSVTIVRDEHANANTEIS